MPIIKMKINTDLVSIITPNYNGARYIASTIKSVIAQTYSNWEMIIIDDRSTDNSISIIEEFKSDSRIKLIRLGVNSGPIIARNKGIEYAKGRYISFLDSDDRWMPEKLKIQLEDMVVKNAGFSFTSYAMITSEDRLINTFNVSAEINYKKLLLCCDIGCSTVVYDTNEIGKQFFDRESPKTGEDYALWLRIARSFPELKMIGVQKSLILYRKHNQGISSNKYSTAINRWKVYRDFEKLSFIETVYNSFQYILHALKKHYFKDK